MSRAMHATQRRHGRWLAVLGVVVALAVGAGIAIAQLGSSDKQLSDPGATATHHHALPTTSSPRSVSQAPAANRPFSAADACAAEIGASEAAVAAASAASEHWRQHVQAQADLRSGKNSEEVTKAIWKRTRLAGPADIATVSNAVSARMKSAGGCAKFSGESAAACRERLKTLDTAAAADRAAAGDWAHHLAMMAAHAAGEFGSDHAQALWVAAWSSAPKNLNAASRANAALTKAPVCKSR